ncbi:MAG: 4'-phosphopantetheinyl transferase superfamily protein [Gemmatimonadaceae bacterium]|nr:4'-phosphopantetheinyl transferase superfamily protein [Gemmatimonadaceae bacterium]
MTDKIEVWRIRPLRRAGDVASLRAILPPGELERSERHPDEAKRRAWVTSRAVLRLLLAHYTHIPANELRFVAGKNGKPYLDLSQNPEGITFNFSDSADMALVAVGWKREVGVDVEQVRTIERAAEIAARRFSSETAAELARTANKDKSRVFLQSWARHEALLKARAGTIWNPGAEPDGLFNVRDLDTGLDYVGALAVQGDGWALNMNDYTD